jgi:hypothetical protein
MWFKNANLIGWKNEPIGFENLSEQQWKISLRVGGGLAEFLLHVLLTAVNKKPSPQACLVKVLCRSKILRLLSRVAILR